MAVKSKLIKIVASQIGPLQAKLRSEIQKKVLELLKEFASGCPNQAKLMQFIKIKKITPFDNATFTPNNQNYEIEIYRPLQQSANAENKVYYECGRHSNDVASC